MKLLTMQKCTKMYLETFQRANFCLRTYKFPIASHSDFVLPFFIIKNKWGIFEDMYSKLRCRRGDRTIFLGQDIHEAAAARILDPGRASFVPLGTDEGCPMKFGDFGIFEDIEPNGQENCLNSKNKMVRILSMLPKIKNIHFFWCRPLLYLLKNTLKAPRDLGSSELTRTSVQWGVGLEWTDDITLLFLNYTGHKLSRIFGPKAIE